jgi:hypothetical protein
MFTRDEQDVVRGLRVQVFERDAGLVFVHAAGRDLARYDAAEQAFVHARLPTGGARTARCSGVSFEAITRPGERQRNRNLRASASPGADDGRSIW